MTKFYEVRRRDGAARIGQLSIRGEKKQTPLLFHVESLHSGKEAIKVIRAEEANFNDLFQVWDVPRGAPS
jgi:queuine/archaeosine tRNA-ribosyltransferase